MIEHAKPTGATAKRLYALAVQCAFPACSEPLYREDVHTGFWVLNSRIAHICARSEGGPRWDDSQTAEDNRSEGNLLVMCITHAATVDEVSGQDTYTPEQLREWKSAQIEEHRKRQQGWPLTMAMANEAVEASFSNVAVAISHSTLNLGGEGGRAPGAGGGGGGAVGPGAQAGRGGNGGSLTDLDGAALAPADVAEFMAGLPMMDPPPGAGGAGAGAVGPHKVGGDGGNGGDGFQGALAVEPGDTFQVEIGEGGLPGNLPGQHGRGGGDTVLTHRSAGGELKGVFRAKGGEAALSGALPDNWFPISQADVDGGFHISTLLTANSLELRDGLLFVLGGGWSTYFVPRLPVEAVWPVGCVATWSTLSKSHCRGLQLCVMNPDGNEASCQVLDLPATAGEGQTYSWIRAIGAPIDTVGCWRIQVKSGAYLLQQIEVAVVLHAGG